jgi:hypothetical protein
MLHFFAIITNDLSTALYKDNKKLKIIKGTHAFTRPTEWAMNPALIPHTAYAIEPTLSSKEL